MKQHAKNEKSESRILRNQVHGGRRQRKKKSFSFFSVTKRRVLTLITFIASVTFFAIIGMKVYAFVYSGKYFEIKKIVIEGNKMLPEKEIRGWFSIEEGGNILQANLESIARIIEQKPQIEKADVIREFPDTLRIHVTEREPFAWIAGRGTLLSTDHYGNIFPMEGKNLRRDMPMITGVEIVADKKRIDSPLFQSALKLLNSLDEVTRKKISEVHLAQDDSLVLYLVNGGLGVVFSGKEENKYASVQRLRNVILSSGKYGLDGVRTVDLRFKDIVLKFNDYKFQKKRR